MTSERQPQPYDSPEVRAAYETLRTHIESIIAPPLCVANGCNEKHPCPPVRAAEAVIAAARGEPELTYERAGLDAPAERLRLSVRTAERTTRPADEEVDRAARAIATHRTDVGYGHPCLECGEPWPCPPYRSAREVMNIFELPYIRIMVTLPDRYADRLPSSQTMAVRQYTDCGVWDEALSLLLACLRHGRVAVTDDERVELAWLADWMHHEDAAVVNALRGA